jgi:hypothetical protein
MKEEVEVETEREEGEIGDWRLQISGWWFRSQAPERT